MNLLLLALLACGDKDDTGTDGGSDGGSDGGADGGADGGSDGGTAADQGTFSGRVVNPDGSGATVQMRLCAELCRSITTDAQGYFEYTQVEADHYVYEAVYLADQNGYSMPLDVITIAQDQQIALDQDMVLYPFETSDEVGDEPVMLNLDGGLTVMADPSTMTASEANSPYLPEGEPDYVASVRVQPDALGLRLEEVEGTVLAAWHMGRVSVSLSPPWGFQLDDTLGLTEGDSVEIIASSYDLKEWTSGGTATVVDGMLVSDDGSGIPILSTVLLVAAP